MTLVGPVCQVAALVGGRTVLTEGELCYPDCLVYSLLAISFQPSLCKYA